MADEPYMKMEVALTREEWVGLLVFAERYCGHTRHVDICRTLNVILCLVLTNPGPFDRLVAALQKYRELEGFPAIHDSDAKLLLARIRARPEYQKYLPEETPA